MLVAADWYTDAEAVGDWFINKRPQVFPTGLFGLLGKMDQDREIWLNANSGYRCEVIAEAWHSPERKQGNP